MTSGLLILSANHAAASPRLQAQLKEQQAALQGLEQEHYLVQSQRSDSLEELQQQERDLQIRRLQLDAMDGRLGDSPDEQALGRLHNERQRLRLAELGAQSLRSTIERMARREQTLASELTQLNRAIERTQAEITRHQAELRQAEQRRADELAAQLAALKEENEALRLSIQADQERSAQLTPPEQEPEPMRPVTPQIERAVDSLTASDDMLRADSQDPTQIVLDDEPPIYQGDDGLDVILRSSGIARPTRLIETGPNIFEADLRVLGSGRVYFDVRRRRYRGVFPTNPEEKFYRFTYDLTDPSRPQLQLRRLADEAQ